MKPSTLRTVGLVCTLVTLSAAALQETVLRVRTFSVLVDVVVTDKNNRYVTDLTQQDFRVLEDGEEQRVDTFYSVRPRVTSEVEAVRKAPLAPAETSDVRESPVVSAQMSERPNLVIILLDFASVEYLNQKYVKDAAVRYVQERMQPNDFMAVFKVGTSLKFVQKFTADKEALIEALHQTDLTGSSYAMDQADLTKAADSVQQDMATLTTSIDAINASGAGSRSPQARAQLEILNQRMEMAQMLEGRYFALRSFSRQQQARPIIGAIETIARGVEHIPGRKTLVMFSQGFSVPLSLEQALYRAVDRANKANLAIYAIDAGGLQFKPAKMEGELYDISALRPGDRTRVYGGLSQFDLAREIGSDQADSTLRYIATATGGFLARHTNDFSKVLEKIDSEVRSHYVLSYQPSNRRFDGAFRNIEVVVRRPDLKVRARPGYWAVPPAASALSPDEFRELISRVSSSVATEQPLAFYTQCSHFRVEELNYLVHLVMEIPTGSLTVQSQPGYSEVDLEAIGLIEDENGEVQSSFRGPSRVQVTPDAAKRSRYLKLENRFTLPPGKYSVVALVSDPSTGRKSLQQRGLLLPAVDDRLSISSLVVGRRAEAADPDSSDLFTLDEVRIMPSAVREFKNGEQLIYYFNLYHPGVGPAHHTRLELELTILHDGQTVSENHERIESAPEAGPVPRIKFARYLELKDLAPGNYLLKATVHDEVRQMTASTQTHFQVVR